MLTFPDGLTTFVGRLMSRLVQGSHDYGDRSFTRPFPEILDEWQDECVDIVGWGYVTWVRIENMREEMRRELERRPGVQQAEDAAPASDSGPEGGGTDS